VQSSHTVHLLLATAASLLAPGQLLLLFLQLRLRLAEKSWIRDLLPAVVGSEGLQSQVDSALGDCLRQRVRLLAFNENVSVPSMSTAKNADTLLLALDVEPAASTNRTDSWEPDR